MKPEWMQWCRDNMSLTMFTDMEADHQHNSRWRDELIDNLRSENERLRKRVDHGT